MTKHTRFFAALFCLAVATHLFCRDADYSSALKVALPVVSRLEQLNCDSATQIVETLEAEVDKHRDGAEPNDDLTIMCVKL